MSHFPSNKTMLITFLVLTSWFGFKFIKDANELFFQLNYNWENEKTLGDFGEASLISVTYNIVEVNLENKGEVSPSNTYKLSNANESYYFRYMYSIIKNNSYKFHGLEWITEMPTLDNPIYTFTEIALPLNQKGEVSTITIGDNYLLGNEAKYFRRFLAQKSDIYFKGRFNDVLNYPHEAIKRNNSRSILKQIKEIEDADSYILFFGSEDKSLPFEEIKTNIKDIIEKLQTDKNAKEITLISLPPSTIKALDDYNITFNKNLKEATKSSDIIFIDSYALFKDDLQKYIREDGFSLTKDAYYKLAQKVSEK